MKRAQATLFSVLFAGLCAAALSADEGPAYNVTDLGSLGGRFVSAFAINQRGDIAGRAELSSRLSHAFLYRKGVMSDLGTLPGKTNSRAQGINDRGQVVGWSFSNRSQSDAHAFLYSQGVMSDLQQLVSLGGSASFASAINKAGHVVGDSLTLNDMEDHAFLFRRGTVLDLGTFGGTYSIADAINSRDQIVGVSSLAGDLVAHAFFWNGGMADLGSLGGSYSEALAINDEGTIAGFSLLAGDGAQHAFQYRHGVLRDLHSRGLPPNSAAIGINNSGQIVGTASPTLDDVFTGNIALIWEGDEVSDLNRLIRAGSGWQLYRAAAINDRGEIAGVGLHNGAIRAFLLTPHDESESR